jgi:hypothetical protein
MNDFRRFGRLGSLINVVACGGFVIVGIVSALANPEFEWGFAIGAALLEIVFIGVFIWVRITAE